MARCEFRGSTILDLELRYDGENQPLEVIALDGVPIGSQQGSGKGRSLIRNHLLIPPAGRAEIIVTGPSDQVREARLITQRVFAGPIGDLNPMRPLFTIATSEAGAAPKDITMVPAVSARRRRSGSQGCPMPRRPSLARSISQRTTGVSSSQWMAKDQGPTIWMTPQRLSRHRDQRRSGRLKSFKENHEFHMHQIHFLLLARDGVPVSAEDRQILDTVNIPFWTGTGPYPSVTLRMDFRGPDVGDFVYHCHILDHEDAGMMAIIRVLPRDNGSSSKSSKSKGPLEASRGAAARIR